MSVVFSWGLFVKDVQYVFQLFHLLVRRTVLRPVLGGQVPAVAAHAPAHRGAGIPSFSVLCSCGRRVAVLVAHIGHTSFLSMDLWRQPAGLANSAYTAWGAVGQVVSWWFRN